MSSRRNCTIDRNSLAKCALLSRRSYTLLQVGFKSVSAHWIYKHLDNQNHTVTQPEFFQGGSPYLFIKLRNVFHTFSRVVYSIHTRYRWSGGGGVWTRDPPVCATSVNHSPKTKHLAAVSPLVISPTLLKTIFCVRCFWLQYYWNS